MDVEDGAQFCFFLSEQISIQKVIGHFDYAIIVQYIQCLQGISVSPSDLSSCILIVVMDNDVIHLAKDTDRSFAAGIDDHQVILWGQFFLFQNVISGFDLLLRHRMCFAAHTPNTDCF